MLGLPKGEVFLAPWSEKWEEEYLLEKKMIIQILFQFFQAGLYTVPITGAKQKG